MAETKLLPNKKQAPAQLGRVLILGLGKTGKVAAHYCMRLLGTRVESVFIAAGVRNDDAEKFATEMEQAGARIAFETETLEESFDLCIASPGISEFSDFYKNAAAASNEIISEIEFAWRESDADSVWVAISGTNGKTTTTSLTAHLLKTAGLNAAAVGNIGDVCLEAVQAGNIDVYVAEVSSYQLASTRDFAPNVAVLLNITPDHLKWHKSMESYVAAKLRLFQNLAQVSGAVAVLDATNDIVRETVKKFKAIPEDERGFSYIPLGTKAGYYESMRNRCGAKNAAYIEDDALCVLFNDKVHVLAKTKDLQLKGEHNFANALAASCAAVALGVNDKVIKEGLKSFAPLEHRLEPCGGVNGVTCYNDSKATNVDATLVALTSFEPGELIVLLGGDDKGTSLDELVAMARKQARHVVCFGAAGPRFAQAFENAGASEMVIRAGKLEDALDAALACAHAGDALVLSPACASFDEFKSFEHRGCEFKRYVAERAAR